MSVNCGITFGGSAIISSYFHAASGGISFGGNAATQATYMHTCSGGIRFMSPPIPNLLGNVISYTPFGGLITNESYLAGKIVISPAYAGEINSSYS